MKALIKSISITKGLVVRAEAFVVTQDIEKGDEVSHIENGRILTTMKTIDSDDKGWIHIDGTYIPYQYCFKILGNASPNAKFIQDGNWYEVREELSGGWVPSYNDPDNKGLAKSAEPTGIYLIKCLCCDTFK